MTVLLCAAAAALVPGTIPHALAGGADPASVRIRHPKGISEAAVRLAAGGVIESVAITRTARRLLAGEAFIR